MEFFLPTELLIIIFNILGKDYYFNISMVCRRWRNIINILKKNNQMKTPARIISQSISLIKWGRANGCPQSIDISNHAATNGNLEVLQWTYHNNYKFNELTCLYAASNGHLEVLKWLREKECPWDERTCNKASENGNLEVFKWLRSQIPPCPMDDSVVYVAINNNHNNITEWLKSENHKWYSN